MFVPFSFFIPHMRESMLFLSFSVWLVSLTTALSRFIHIQSVANGSSSSFSWLPSIPSHVYATSGFSFLPSSQRMPVMFDLFHCFVWLTWFLPLKDPNFQRTFWMTVTLQVSPSAAPGMAQEEPGSMRGTAHPALLRSEGRHLVFQVVASSSSVLYAFLQKLQEWALMKKSKVSVALPPIPEFPQWACWIRPAFMSEGRTFTNN